MFLTVPISPYVFRGSTIQSTSSKESDSKPGETSRSNATNPQPTLSSKHPGPALPVQQIKRQTSSSKFYKPAKWGVPSPPVRTSKVILARVCARALPWSLTSASAWPWRKPIRRDQRPALADQAPIRFTQIPCSCVTSPQIHASERSTQIPWGAWAWRQRRRRRRWRRQVRGAAACV